MQIEPFLLAAILNWKPFGQKGLNGIFWKTKSSVETVSQA